ncbi:MAG: WG repeat-containing protein [Clostridia bacterium]|nr:WG repeat-containing protein [Clostridia bacterium]MDE7329454.1 WG repeat-containing protein [Clostridia bacterium]
MSKGKFHHNKNKSKVLSGEEKLELAASLNANAKKEDLLRPIEDLNLSENTFNALKAGRVENLADLACRSFSQMFKIQNIGKRNCIEISNALKKFGADFAKEAPQENKEQRNDGRAKKDDNSQDVKSKNGSGDRNRNAQSSANNDRNRRNDNVDRNQNRNKNDRNARGDRNGERFDRREDSKNKNKNKGENAQLNDYLSRLYAGLSMSEILMGKRQRPAVEKIERPPLTETSLVKFCRKGKWGYKDWKGNVIVPPQYDEAFGFSEERGCVEMEGKLGYIDRKNNLVIEYKYDSATSFSEGLASVTIGEKSGYIDSDGNQVIDFIYDVATPFYDGKAIVRADDRWGVLSRENLSVFWR